MWLPWLISKPYLAHSVLVDESSESRAQMFKVELLISLFGFTRVRYKVAVFNAASALTCERSTAQSAAQCRSKDTAMVKGHGDGSESSRNDACSGSCLQNPLADLTMGHSFKLSKAMNAAGDFSSAPGCCNL